MPTYFALGTRISLRVWDPKQANEQPLDGQFDHAKVKGPPRYKLLHNVDPAAGYMVETLKEEYYEGHGGVHFLGIGCDMPFYLVRAGSDLFPTLTPMPLLEHQAHTMSAPLVVKSGTESFLSTVSRSLFVNSSPIAGLNGKDEVESRFLVSIPEDSGS